MYLKHFHNYFGAPVFLRTQIVSPGKQKS